MTNKKRSFSHQAGNRMIYLLLGDKIYRDKLACLWEAVKNAAMACQSNRKKWDPKRVFVDIILATELPFVRAMSDGKTGRACVILDHGAGLTDENLRRFSEVGPNEEMEESGSGISQKRIGRFAIDALCGPSEAFGDSHVYFLVTRAQKNGPIEYARICRDDYVLDGGKGRDVALATIDHNDPILKGILPEDGRTFTAVVVPDPVEELTAKNISEGLAERYLPRGERFGLDVRINGKRIGVPDLPPHSRSSEDGKYTAFLRYTGKDGAKCQIMLCDGMTGFPIAPLNLVGRFGPDLGSHHIDGVILADPALHLLARQDTSRSGISAEFTGTKEWQDAKAAILGSFSKFAESLAHEHGRLGGGRDAAILDGVFQECRVTWPEDLPPPPPPGGGGGGGKGGKKGKRGTPPSPPPEREPRVFVPIGGRNWEARRIELPPHVFMAATIDDGGNAVLQVNLGEERCTYRPKTADLPEFFRNELISAIAWAETIFENGDPNATPAPSELQNKFAERKGELFAQLRQQKA